MGKHHYHQPEMHVEEPEVVLPRVKEPDVAAAVVEEAPTVIAGVVTDCAKLNVRRAPSMNATVVCEIPRKSVVTIDEDKSNAEWYGVCTATGVNGFCMKKYVAISQ